jgi:catechol 2,3-dioxygenase-like lactoylglutathione lyase family enzyme
MKYIHTGLAASSEKNADRFYTGILGLTKSEQKIIDKKLIQAIFAIDSELVMMNYQNQTVHYEIFIQHGYSAPKKQLAHSCIKVSDLAGIVKKCRNEGLKIVQIPKGKAMLTFISDYDGNLFEIKE